MKLPARSIAVLRLVTSGFLWCGAAVPLLAQRSGPGPAGRPVFEEWTTYLNSRFAYQIPVPPGMQAQSDSRKGGSCRFLSADGVLALRVWGASLKDAPGDPLAGAWREALDRPGRRIDFQRRMPQAFVVAGATADGREFFEKIILGNGAIAGYNISYPPSQARRYARIADEVEQGFGWDPEAPALTPEGQPQRGFFSGVRGYFTGEDEPAEEPLPPDDGPAPVRDPDKTKIDLTPPPPREKPSDGPLEKPGKPGTSPSPVNPSPAKREDLPYGIVIPGKKGYVYSPFVDNKQQVDVTDIPTGTKVKCPYTGKVFRVP